MARPRKKRLLSMLASKNATAAEKLVAERQLKREKRIESQAAAKAKKKKAKRPKPSKFIEHPEIKMVAEHDKKQADARKKEAGKKKKKTERLKADRKLLTNAEVRQLKRKINDFDYMLKRLVHPPLHKDHIIQLEIMAENYIRENFDARIKLDDPRLYKILYPEATVKLTTEQRYFDKWRKYGINPKRQKHWDKKLNHDRKFFNYVNNMGMMPNITELAQQRNIDAFVDAICYIEAHTKYYGVKRKDKEFFRHVRSTYEANKLFRTYESGA